MPRRHSVEAFAQAIRAIGEPIHNRAAEDISMAKLLTLLFEVTGLFVTCARAPESCCCRRPWWWQRASRAGSIPSSTCGPSPSRSCGNGSSAISVRPASDEGAAEGALEVGRFLGQVPGLLARGAALVEQLDAVTRNGLVLAPETVAEIGRAEARRTRWSTAALWLIAVLLVWLIIRMA